MTVKLKLKTIYAKGVAEHVHPYSFMVFKKNGNYYVRDHNGNLKFSGVDAFSIFKSIESAAFENQLIVVKNGDYLFSQKWVPTKKLRLHGEGSGTRLLPSGTFDAIDPSNLSLLNILWRDANNVDHDASFDPEIFRQALKDELQTSWKSYFGSFEFANVWVYGENIYFGCRVENQADSAPALFKINPQGKVEVLATKGDIKSLNTYEKSYFLEVVSVLELPNNAIIFSTHTWCELIKRDVNGNLAVKYNVMGNVGAETVYGMCMDDEGSLYAATYDSYPSQGYILKSTDKGETWSTIYGAISGSPFFDIEFRRKVAGTVLLVASLNGIYRSTDRGSTFTKVWDEQARDIEYIGANTWIAYRDGRDYFFISFDDGETWQRVANRTGVEKEWSINTLKADALGRLWVAGFGALACSRNGGSTWRVSDFNRLLLRDFRGVGVTSTHLYIGSQIRTGHAFFTAGKVGHILIVPVNRIPETSGYPPQVLWKGETILAASPEETYPILISGVKEKTVYIKSNQSGTARILMYNEVSKSYEEVDSFSVSANVLTKFSFTYVGRAFKLRFEPSVDATVDAWVALGD